jgi:MFS family permease
MSLRLLEPFSNRDFRLLWAGQAISYVGNGVMTVALAWQTLAVSPKATSLSLVLLARSVPLVALSLLGGALTDRLPRRAIMIVSDVARAAVVALAAVLVTTDAIELWHLVVLSGIFGAGEAFFFPAFMSFVPDVVSADQLVQANSLEAAVRPLTMRMAGPALGGLLVAGIGPGFAFAFDAATFAFSAACFLAVRARGATTREHRSTLLRDIAEGFRYTRSQVWIWGTLLMAAFAVLCFIGPADVLLPIFAREHLRAGARGYGLMIAAMGLGGIIGALTVSQTGIGRRRVRNMFVVWGVSVLPFALLSLTDHLAVAMILLGLTGFGFEVGTVMWTTLLQDLVPRHFMGRVRSLDFLMSFALMPVSYAAAGPLASQIGVLPTIGLGGALAAVFTFAFMLYPNVLEPDRSGYVPPAGSKAAEASLSAAG